MYNIAYTYTILGRFFLIFVLLIYTDKVSGPAAVFGKLYAHAHNNRVCQLLNEEVEYKRAGTAPKWPSFRADNLKKW